MWERTASQWTLDEKLIEETMEKFVHINFYQWVKLFDSDLGRSIVC